ncbi:MAG: iron ABC transporter permease [Planctomycetota bacterium]
MKYITRTTALAFFFIFTVLPIAVILVFSFRQEGSFAFSRFFEAFSNDRLLGIALKNFLLAGAATLISSLLAIPAAWLCSRTNTPLAKVFTLFAVIPLLIPSHTVAYSWMQAMSIVGEVVHGREGMPLIQYFNAPFCAFVLAMYFFPVMFYGAFAAFRSADPLRENIALMYQPPWRVAMKIVLPAAFPVLMASLGFTFLLMFAEYGIPAMHTVNTFVGEIFVLMSARVDVGSALALSLTLFLFMVAFGWFVFRRLPAGFFFTESENIRPHTRFDLGGLRHWATLFLMIVIALTIVIPLGALIVRAFALAGDPHSFEPSYFAGLKYFKEGIQYSRRELKTTMMITPVVSVLSVLIALPIARMFALGARKYMYVAFVLCALMFLVPGTVFATGMLYFYAHKIFDPIYSSSVILIIGHVGRFTPLAVLILAAGMIRVGRKPEFIARLHGVSDLNAYLEVFLPAIKFEFWLSVMAVAVFSMSELGASHLLSAAGISTVTSALYIMMHYGNEERVSALALMQILMILAPVAFYGVFRFTARGSRAVAK